MEVNYEEVGSYGKLLIYTLRAGYASLSDGEVNGSSRNTGFTPIDRYLKIQDVQSVRFSSEYNRRGFEGE